MGTLLCGYPARGGPSVQGLFSKGTLCVQTCFAGDYSIEIPGQSYSDSLEPKAVDSKFRKRKRPK